MTVREKVVLIQKAIGDINSLDTNIADARIQLEKLRRNPELGMRVVRGPNDKPVKQTILTAEQVANGIRDIQKEREVAVETLRYLTGLDKDEAEIRTLFRLYSSVHAEVSVLRDQLTGIALGVSRDILGIEDNEVDAAAKLGGREETLAELDELFNVPEISSLELPSTKIEL